MTKKRKHQILTLFISAVWVINGLFCKVLNLVPRHQEIVERILGGGHARLLTLLIGFAEIAMAIWIMSGILTRINTTTQIIIIAIMNTIEFLIAPDLLLWGKANAVFAFLFMSVIYYNEYCLNKKPALQS
jgi:hypothetical protein